ncbi:hypothetical protein ACFS07_02120 [Undibacterium arcticum]
MALQSHPILVIARYRWQARTDSCCRQTTGDKWIDETFISSERAYAERRTWYRRFFLSDAELAAKAAAAPAVPTGMVPQQAAAATPAELQELRHQYEVLSNLEDAVGKLQQRWRWVWGVGPAAGTGRSGRPDRVFMDAIGAHTGARTIVHQQARDQQRDERGITAGSHRLDRGRQRAKLGRASCAAPASRQLNGGRRRQCSANRRPALARGAGDQSESGSPSSEPSGGQETGGGRYDPGHALQRSRTGNGVMRYQGPLAMQDPPEERYEQDPHHGCAVPDVAADADPVAAVACTA